MFGRNAKPAAGLGTFFHAGGTTVAHVRRDGERFTVVALGPDAGAPGHPVSRGVAFAELMGVMHALDLPPADAAAMPKLIAAQLETLIPDQAEHVRWGWQRDGDAGPVRVVTAARRRVESLLKNADLTPPPDLVTTPALALGQVFAHALGEDERRDLAVFGLDGPRLHLLRYRAGKLDTLDTLMLDEASEESQAQAIAALAGGSAPERFTLVAPSAPPTELLAALQRRWPDAYHEADVLLNLPGLSGQRINLPDLIAVGTAMAAADPKHSINLAPRETAEADRAAGQPSRRRWIAAAALLVLGLGLLYYSDTRRADALAEAVQDAGLEAKDLISLNTELAVARHLETSGPSFLAILDELSHRTEGFIIDELRYERGGQFTLRATGRSAQQINQLAATLTEMKTLDSVQVRNQAATGRDEIEYTITAVPAPRFFAAFAPPESTTPPESTPIPEAKADPETKPATDAGDVQDDVVPEASAQALEMLPGGVGHE